MDIIVDTQKTEEIQGGVCAIDSYKQGVFALSRTLYEFRETVNQAMIPALASMVQQNQYLIDVLNDFYMQYKDIFTNIGTGVLGFSDSVNNLSHLLLHHYCDGVPEEEQEEINEANEKIITEIFQPDTEKKIDIEESPIIILSPINEMVLKYLAENPEAFYKLSDIDFEIVMAEIYSKLGYDVTRTQSTRDGGKDIIIRKPEIIGDFIYYVECKKYAPQRHIGVGIVRNLVGTVTTDRVNGGILATTSFFTRDARQFILDNKLNCQIKMQDYNEIQALLNKAIK